MARKSKDSTAVRLAFTGPTVEPDELIDQAIDRNEEDRKRASSAGESRSKIKAFLDQTGINGKALSWLRMILKTADKDDGTAKAMDVIMSLETCLPIIKDHVAGQGTTPMDFGVVKPAAPSYAQDFDPTDDSLPPVFSDPMHADDVESQDDNPGDDGTDAGEVQEAAGYPADQDDDAPVEPYNGDDSDFMAAAE